MVFFENPPEGAKDEFEALFDESLKTDMFGACGKNKPWNKRLFSGTILDIRMYVLKYIGIPNCIYVYILTHLIFF